jgi:putative tryptophan/tyrosine transport system substrate-binding protein
MNKKLLIGIIVGLAIAAGIGACFLSALVKTPKLYRVGILSGLNRSIIIGDTFKQEMAKLGYIEGKNVSYNYEKTNFEPEKEKQIIDKFVADKVDLIFGFNTDVALEVKQAIKGTKVPLVFAMGTLEGNDLVDSVQAPGGNITGVRYPGVDFAVARLKILNEILPKAERIFIPYQKGYPIASYELEALRPVASSLGLTLIEFPANDLAALRTELENRSQVKDIGFDAVLYIPESLSTDRRTFDLIAEFTRDRKIPIGGTIVPPIDATPEIMKDYGPLFGVTVDYKEQGILAAQLADKILKGTPAGTIMVASPNEYIQINYKVAKELGLAIPDELLNRANEVIH